MVQGFRHLVLAAFVVLGCATAAPVQAGVSLWAEETGRTTVPYGWVDFCNRYAGECDASAEKTEAVKLTPAALKEIEKINRAVNTAVTSVTDMEQWGVVDRWDYPMNGKGDCEDYALLKRKMLIAQGFSTSTVLMTVVKDHAGEGHAILTVKTDKGDFELDNLNDRVIRWDETGYRFVKRQSQDDPNRWVSLGAPTSAPLYTAR